MSILNSFVNGMFLNCIALSWSDLFQISSSASLVRLPSLPPTTRSPPSLPERSRPQFVSSSLVSLPSTPFPRVPRLLPSTLPRRNRCLEGLICFGHLVFHAWHQGVMNLRFHGDPALFSGLHNALRMVLFFFLGAMSSHGQRGSRLYNKHRE